MASRGHGASTETHVRVVSSMIGVKATVDGEQSLQRCLPTTEGWRGRVGRGDTIAKPSHEAV